jgi:hypothetical protein
MAGGQAEYPNHSIGLWAGASSPSVPAAGRLMTTPASCRLYLLRYYNPNDILRDFGTITTYQAPKVR